MLNRLPHMQVYPLIDPVFVRASGETVVDADGVEYTDLYAGHAVASIGHCHPKWVEAISRQAATLGFYSNAVDIEVRNAFCRRLVEVAPTELSTVFLCNSGAEANENALTLARLFTGRKNVVSLEGGFHGRTLQTLALSGIEKYRKLSMAGGTPILDNVRIMPRGDFDAIAKTIDETVAAVIVEPVQGLAGAISLGTAYLQALRARCNETGTVLVFDEVQCGSGRTGRFLAGETLGVTPDVATLAKGLAGGFPIGAVIAKPRISAVAGSGMLGTTFGGGPMACAAGLATLDVMVGEDLFANVREVSAFMRAELMKTGLVRDVSGEGFLMGVRLDRDAGPVRSQLLMTHHMVTGSCTDPCVIRLLPPLTMKKATAERFVVALTNVLG